jgi:hypothetical protein
MFSASPIFLFSFNSRDNRQIFTGRVATAKLNCRYAATRAERLQYQEHFSLRKEKSPNRLSYYQPGDFFLAF